MGILTGILIVCGAVAAIGTAGHIIHEATEDKRNEAEIAALKAENASLENAKKYINSIKNDLIAAKDKLNESKKHFKDGGHVMNGVPLANSEFSNSISKIEAAIKNATNLISDFNETIENNKKRIKELS